MEVFFQAPQLRTFQYNFTFSPRNEDERDDVQKIIRMFRFHMAPELRSGQNMFMTLPSEFDISNLIFFSGNIHLDNGLHQNFSVVKNGKCVYSISDTYCLCAF